MTLPRAWKYVFALLALAMMYGAAPKPLSLSERIDRHIDKDKHGYFAEPRTNRQLIRNLNVMGNKLNQNMTDLTYTLNHNPARQEAIEEHIVDSMAINRKLHERLARMWQIVERKK